MGDRRKLLKSAGFDARGATDRWPLNNYNWFVISSSRNRRSTESCRRSPSHNRVPTGHKNRNRSHNRRSTATRRPLRRQRLRPTRARNVHRAKALRANCQPTCCRTNYLPTCCRTNYLCPPKPLGLDPCPDERTCPDRPFPFSQGQQRSWREHR